MSLSTCIMQWPYHALNLVIIILQWLNYFTLACKCLDWWGWGWFKVLHYWESKIPRICCHHRKNWIISARVFKYDSSNPCYHHLTKRLALMSGYWEDENHLSDLFGLKITFIGLLIGDLWTLLFSLRPGSSECVYIETWCFTTVSWVPSGNAIIVA